MKKTHLISQSASVSPMIQQSQQLKQEEEEEELKQQEKLRILHFKEPESTDWSKQKSFEPNLSKFPNKSILKQHSKYSITPNVPCSKKSPNKLNTNKKLRLKNLEEMGVVAWTKVVIPEQENSANLQFQTMENWLLNVDHMSSSTAVLSKVDSQQTL